MAEGVLQHMAKKEGLNWQIDSAGTNGFHNGEAPHHLSQKVCRQHQIDIGHQISRKFSSQDCLHYDLIYAMAEDVIEDIKKIAGSYYPEKKVKLFLEEHFPGEAQDVPDPWYGAEEGYHKVFDLIEKNCTTIIKKYTK